MEPEEYEERKKKWHLDVENTPCARNALLHGIAGGAGVGLITFARTSRVRRSCDLAVVGFAVVSLCSFEVCRMVKAKHRADVKRTVHVLNTLQQQKANKQHSKLTEDTSNTLQSPK